jgi:predicted permease
MLLAASVLSLGTGLLFGLFPALHATRPDLAPVLKGHSGQPSGARTAKRFRLTLATIQIALSMALLVGAGLFTRSLYNVSRVELGLKTDKLVTFSVTPQMNGYSIERSQALFERLETELSSQPGVAAVSAALVPTLAGVSWGTDVAVEGFKSGPDINSNSRYNAVGAGYFGTMGMPLVAGREFTPADRLGSPRVAIINESFARKFNLGADAVGKRMGWQRGGGSPLDSEIIAVVRDAKYSEVKGNVPALFFLPYRQDDTVGSLTFYIRTSFEPDAILASVRDIVARLDANLPVDNLRTMDRQVQENVSIDRFLMILSASFAVLATLLAAVGLYGVLAYTVAQRTREIGLRMALGAAPGKVRRMILRQVGIMTVIGSFIGLSAGLWIASAAKSQLFQMEGPDVSVFAGALLLLGCVAITAGFVPAHRASRVDPMTALRYE